MPRVIATVTEHHRWCPRGCDTTTLTRNCATWAEAHELRLWFMRQAEVVRGKPNFDVDCTIEESHLGAE
jgi:hypothetical protein